MISDLNMLLIHYDSIVYGLRTLLSGTNGPEVTEIGITGGNGFDVRITCVQEC